MNSNVIVIKIPKWIQQALRQSNLQGVERCHDLIEKLGFEFKCIKSGDKIPYDNTVL